MLYHGQKRADTFSPIKHSRPLHMISYSHPSHISTNVENASLPSDADSILNDSRTEGISAYTRKVSEVIR